MLELWAFVIFYGSMLLKLVLGAIGIGLVVAAYVTIPLVSMFVGMSVGGMFWLGVAMAEAGVIGLGLSVVVPRWRGRYERRAKHV